MRASQARHSVRAAGALADVPVALTSRLRERLGSCLDGWRERARDDLQVKLAGEEISASGLYDWHRGQTRVVLSAKGPRFGPLAEALCRTTCRRLYRTRRAGRADGSPRALGRR
jgi:hypothetical protein